jgi:hypothetical protein
MPMKCSKQISAVLLLGLAQATMAANLVPNPDFATDLNGWTAAPGATFLFDTTTGMPAPSATVAVPSGGPDGWIRSTCIQIDASQNVDFVVSAWCAGPVNVDFNLNAFSDTNCSVPISTAAHLAVGGLFHTWLGKSQMNFALPVSTQSVQVEVPLIPFGGGRIDRIRFGPTGTTPVSLQSFDVD